MDPETDAQYEGGFSTLSPIQLFTCLSDTSSLDNEAAVAKVSNVALQVPVGAFDLRHSGDLHPDAVAEFFGPDFQEVHIPKEQAQTLLSLLGLPEAKLQEISFQDFNINGNPVEFTVYPYRLNDDEPGEEIGADEDVPACTQWMLPSRQLHGLWDTLLYDTSIKDRLMSYTYAAMMFSDSDVDPNLVTWNRVVLLHGPPGTGKTSLCKALAQRLSIVLGHRYDSGQLVEVNSHSLFSKWFSESGKLVMKMFQQIEELAQYESSFVCVLLDEVESLTAARKAAMAGTEPSDAIRVVNAVLTQIDRLKKYPNVLIMTTSNITGAIDVAFVDRADIKEYIGLPGTKAVDGILRSCINELMYKGIIARPHPLVSSLPASSESPFILPAGAEGNGSDLSWAQGVTQQLASIAEEAAGKLSGRALRKLPFLAYASSLSAHKPEKKQISLSDFLHALDSALHRELQVRDTMEQG